MATSPRPSSDFPTLAGKVAIVTGASRGIGAGIALQLARRGAKIVINYSSPSSEESVDALIGEIDSLDNDSSAIKVQADLRQPSAPELIVGAATRAFGNHIDILVNNAGVELVKSLGSITPSDFSSVYNLNVLAPLLLTQAVLPYLRRPGRVINIGSVGARHGFKSLSVYCSSKAALEGLTRCWAAELGEAGHTVNAINPGPVKTQLVESIPLDIVEMQRMQTPVEKRIGTVDDVAQIAAWLATEESRWISGQVLSASGGWTMY